MKIHQNQGPAVNQAQRLQNALGLFKPPSGGVGSLNRGIGVVDPDDDIAYALENLLRGPGDGVPSAAYAPCQTDLSTDERISEAPKLNHAIHRIKYNYQLPLGFCARINDAMISTESVLWAVRAKSIAESPRPFFNDGSAPASSSN
jgi:hypothetical protein